MSSCCLVVVIPMADSSIYNIIIFIFHSELNLAIATLISDRVTDTLLAELSQCNLLLVGLLTYCAISVLSHIFHCLFFYFPIENEFKSVQRSLDIRDHASKRF